MSREWCILDSARISQNSRHERLNIIVDEKRNGTFGGIFVNEPIVRTNTELTATMTTIMFVQAKNRLLLHTF